eukprot:441062_1
MKSAHTMSLNQQRLTKGIAYDHLSEMGFKQNRIKRAFKLFEKSYPIYNIGVIKEIIYRLTIKDKLKQIKKGSNSRIYYSRVNVKQALEAMCFDEYHIDLAIKQYEKQKRESAYYLQEIIEILMQFRATHPYPIEPDVDIDVSLSTVTQTPPISKSISKSKSKSKTHSDNSSPKKHIHKNDKNDIKPIHILQPHLHLRHDTILSNEEVECKNKINKIQKQITNRSNIDKLFEGASPLIRTLTV